MITKTINELENICKNTMLSSRIATYKNAIRLLKILEPTSPIMIDDCYGDKTISCPNCNNAVINYYNANVKPQHCMFCGQAILW